MIKLKINEEYVDSKTYLFRGESNNSYQSNYSNKVKLPFKSRFFSYEVFDDIFMFGDVVVYELLNNSRIWDYGEGVEDFIEEFSLVDYEFPELYKVYKIHSLSELQEYGGTVRCDYHNLYHAQQLCAIGYLENNYSNEYDGIEFYEPQDNPETQLVIWNMNIVRRLSYSEAKQIITKLKDYWENELGDYDSIYSNDWDNKPKFYLHR